MDDQDIRDFLPYLLNQAAEEASAVFSRHYDERYGMRRTDWRVLFHLGRYGEMTAGEISRASKVHKTKISRAVARLEDLGFITRKTAEVDRRREMLALTAEGSDAFRELTRRAGEIDRELLSIFPPDDAAILKRCLVRLASLPAPLSVAPAARADDEGGEG